jgi:hypothetical protein
MQSVEAQRTGERLQAPVDVQEPSGLFTSPTSASWPSCPQARPTPWL